MTATTPRSQASQPFTHFQQIIAVEPAIGGTKPDQIRRMLPPPSRHAAIDVTYHDHPEELASLQDRCSSCGSLCQLIFARGLSGRSVSPCNSAGGFCAAQQAHMMSRLSPPRESGPDGFLGVSSGLIGCDATRYSKAVVYVPEMY